MVLLAGVASATPPEASLRPVERQIAPESALLDIRPVMRPASQGTVHPGSALLLEAQDGLAQIINAQAAVFSLRPNARPNSIVQKAMSKRRERRRGAICGDLDIQGDEVGFVPGRMQGCGVADAVKVRSVSGVGLSQAAIMDCPTARALKTWVDKSAKPALRNKGGGLVRLKVAAHYACRTRNNRPGAKISEHGRGRAIDISGFYLKNGDLATVLRGWNERGMRGAMRKMHKGACGPFGTVLGPNADRFHRDHFHFDTARYRSGPYCR